MCGGRLCTKKRQCLSQEKARQVLASDGAVSPTAVDRHMASQPSRTDERGAHKTGQRPDEGTAPDASGGAIELPSSGSEAAGSSDDDVPMLSAPAAPRCSTRADMQVMLPTGLSISVMSGLSGRCFQLAQHCNCFQRRGAAGVKADIAAWLSAGRQ